MNDSQVPSGSSSPRFWRNHFILSAGLLGIALLQLALTDHPSRKNYILLTLMVGMAAQSIIELLQAGVLRTVARIVGWIAIVCTIALIIVDLNA